MPLSEQLLSSAPSRLTQHESFLSLIIRNQTPWCCVFVCLFCEETVASFRDVLSTEGLQKQSFPGKACLEWAEASEPGLRRFIKPIQSESLDWRLTGNIRHPVLEGSADTALTFPEWHIRIRKSWIMLQYFCLYKYNFYAKRTNIILQPDCRTSLSVSNILIVVFLDIVFQFQTYYLSSSWITM